LSHSTWSRILSALTVVTAIIAAHMILRPLAVFSQQANNPSEHVRSLNNQLLQVYARLGALSNSEAAAVALRSQGAEIIKQRAAALMELIQQSPSQALSIAFSDDVLSRLRKAFPESITSLESVGSWQGATEYLIEDGADFKTYQKHFSITTSTETLNVHFASQVPANLQSGKILRVTGIRVGTEVAADGGTVTGTVTGAAAMCTPLGEQRTLVLLVTTPGVPAPALTPAYFANLLFGSSGLSLSEFWRESSYGVTTASGDVLGWYTLDANYTCDQTSQIRDAAIRAVDSVVDFRQYSRIFLIMSGVYGGCGWAGLATVGCSSLSSAGDGNFTASTAWMYSEIFISRETGITLAIHEGGHNLGLDHASSRGFRPEALGAPGLAGVMNEYGDEFSAMSSASFGHYAAPHKAKLGWLTSDVQTVTGSGSFSIQPTEVGGGLHALKVRRGSDDNNWLWVEYRQPLGVFDSTLKPQIFGGGLIHYQDTSTGAYTHLLDFTPNTTSWADPALLAGQSWVDPYTNVSIAIDNASSTALNVSVAYGPAVCTPAAPTVTLSPANPSAYAGNPVNYTVTIANKDSEQCAPRGFNLSSLVPGWQTTFSQDSLVLSPLASTSVTMSKLVPADTLPATYSVDALVMSTLGSVDGTANVTVVPIPCTAAAPVIALTSSVSNAFPGDTVDYAIVVTNNDAGSCVSRTFNLSSSMPSGWTTAFSQMSLTVASSSTASAKMSKTVPSSASPGTYAANVIATDGSSSVEGKANVTIQLIPLAITLSTSSGPFTKGSTVAITAKVMQGSINAPGASVVFTMISPNGTTSTRKMTADSNGVVVWSYRVGPKDAKGNYHVTAEAKFGSQSASSTTVAFSVE
jgi:M6 family metalloprotease-like protein